MLTDDGRVWALAIFTCSPPRSARAWGFNWTHAASHFAERAACTLPLAHLRPPAGFCQRGSFSTCKPCNPGCCFAFPAEISSTLMLEIAL